MRLPGVRSQHIFFFVGDYRRAAFALKRVTCTALPQAAAKGLGEREPAGMVAVGTRPTHPTNLMAPAR